MTTIHITEANHGQHLLVGADILTIKAWSQDTAASMLVFKTRVAPGGGPPMLRQHAYSEVFYFLDGEFKISTADADNRLQTFIVKAGGTVAIPSMAWHNFKIIPVPSRHEGFVGVANER
jgi:mannose-6-phosphate isomerase-like protein (cupin superfamily)